MRDVEDGFALSGKQFEQIFEQAAGDNIEPAERFIEDEQFGIVQQGRGDEHALAHALGVGGDGRVLPGFEVEKAEQVGGLGLDECFVEATETTDQLQVFEAG